MLSTLSSPMPDYLGIDLTDRYSATCRDIDVCGLNVQPDGSLRATYWRWLWDRAPLPLDVSSIRLEIRAARFTMIDGPQGLATLGATIRIYEHQSAAVGKTPDTRPNLSKPFAGFLQSSIELFAALNQ